HTTTLPLRSSPFLSTATAPTPTSTLSLHDALPISAPEPRDAARRPARSRRQPIGVGLQERRDARADVDRGGPTPASDRSGSRPRDRKSTRLNSSHLGISYAVFCLKKKKHRNRISSK